MLKSYAVIIILICSLQLSRGHAQNKSLKIIQVPQMEELMSVEEGKLKIVNFWATWCKPCIKELPYFVQAIENYPEVEFIFISLDFAEKAEKVEAFAKKKGLDKGEIYLIDDLDYNSWIDKVSPEWSGAIPATLLVSENGKQFYEKEFHSGELEALIKERKK